MPRTHLHTHSVTLECYDCPWHAFCPALPYATHKARKHARDRGHMVVIMAIKIGRIDGHPSTTQEPTR